MHYEVKCSSLHWFELFSFQQGIQNLQTHLLCMLHNETHHTHALEKTDDRKLSQFFTDDNGKSSQDDWE